MSRKLITRRELAVVLNVHPMTVSKWEREGLPIAEVGRRGQASLDSVADTRKWIKARELKAKAAAAGRGTVVDLTRERARKEKAQALVQEQTLAIRARELVPRAEVEEAWSKEVTAVRAKLLSWPATLSDQLHRAAELGGRTGGARNIEEVLGRAVEELLHELSAPSSTRPAAAKKKKKKVRSSRTAKKKGKR